MTQDLEGIEEKIIGVVVKLCAVQEKLRSLVMLKKERQSCRTIKKTLPLPNKYCSKH